MNLTKVIEQSVDKLIKELGIAKIDYGVDHPAEIKHGDYAVNVAMVGYRQVKDKFKSPQELADKIVEKLKAEEKMNKIAEKITVEGPGFINISIKNEVLVREIGRLLKGVSKKGSFWGKKVMVEYAHPNTHKEFHIGHLRNIALGESISRILEAVGTKVIKTNYQGDVGLHIAKAMWGIKQNIAEYEKVKKQDVFAKVKYLGKIYSVGGQAYEKDKKAKEEILDFNEQIYAEKGEIVALWKETVKWSLDYFDKIYKRVGTKFDRLYFESECTDGVDIAKKALKKGILKKSQGAVVFDGSKYGLDTRVFITKKGLPTYEAKELSLAPKEFAEFGEIDKNIHVVGPEQQSFFSVTFKVEELIDPKRFKGKQYHRVYAYVKLKKGKMSSRKGQIVTGWWLLDEAKKRIMKNYKAKEAVAEKIAVGAVKYAFLKVQPLSEIVFDFEESISLEGNSGPYLQYTYARCKSVLNKADLQDFSVKVKKLEKEEEYLLRTIYRFGEVVEEAAKELSPNLVANFLYDLAQKYNSFYNKHPILKAEKEKKELRLWLTQTVAKVIKDGLVLLGIETLERM